MARGEPYVYGRLPRRTLRARALERLGLYDNGELSEKVHRSAERLARSRAREYNTRDPEQAQEEGSYV